MFKRRNETWLAFQTYSSTMLIYYSSFFLGPWHFRVPVMGTAPLLSGADSSLHMLFSHEPSSHKTRSNQFHRSPSFSLQELFMHACVMKQIHFSSFPPPPPLQAVYSGVFFVLVFFGVPLLEFLPNVHFGKQNAHSRRTGKFPL